MKTKSIIFSGLLLAAVGATTTSCEDMFTVEDEMHTTNLAPQDTIYQMMGIINRMQVLVDRTILLGELRADLVDIDPTVAKASLQDIINNNITTENEYNRIADYYAVVNTCNIFLNYVDSTARSHNEFIFEKEIQAVKTFRAWTYLELVKVYGKVPFVLEPILTSGAADKILESGEEADMGTICSYFIDDLLPYASKEISAPNYGSISSSYKSSNFFISPRLMLAELYLWRGSFTQSQADYVEACRYYHDFFYFPGYEGSRYITTGTQKARGWTREIKNEPSAGSFSYDDEAVGLLPLDTCDYFGNWSNIYAVFNSQFETNYYVPVKWSKRLRELSQEQIFCVFYQNDAFQRDTIYSSEIEEWEDSLWMGDLRLYSTYKEQDVGGDLYTDIYSRIRVTNSKYEGERNGGGDSKVTGYRFFRKNMIWLHFAEALNRAGFPQTAMVILKYGISSNTLNKYLLESEYRNLMDVETQYGGSLTGWSSIRYVDMASVLPDRSQTMQGIHSRGCGDSEYNDLYVIPRWSESWVPYDSVSAVYDSLSTVYYAIKYDLVRDHDTTYVYNRYDEDGNLIGTETVTRPVYRYEFEDPEMTEEIYKALQDEMSNASSEKYRLDKIIYADDQQKAMDYVEKLILDEEALEGAFEGYRFYDLMRWAMYHGDKDFIGNTVNQRLGKDNYDTRGDFYKGGNWYLPKPKK